MKNIKKSIWSWAFYDWANSAFATTVMAGFFPLFFKAYWANPDNPGESTFYLGMANSIASIIVACLAPFLGAVADKGSAKKKFLFLFAFLGVIMTGSLYMVAQGHWLLAVIFFVGASVGFAGGNIFYDSLLVNVASKDKMDYVSSLGYSVGYIGGGLLFTLNVLMLTKLEWFCIPDKSTAIKLSFLSVAIWWALFSIPIFLFVKEPKVEKTINLLKAVKLGWGQLLNTLKEIRQLKVVGIFLLAYWLYIDGVDTIIVMAVDYGMSLGLQQSSLMVALLIVQFIAFPATLIYIWISSKIGVKNAVFVAISGYILITFLAYFMSKEWHFYGLAVTVGLFQGGIQALSRSMFARFVPENKSAEFFGFYNMLGKFSHVLGPVLMGSVTILTGNVRFGILSILALFLLGAFLLTKVDIAEGERIARDNLS